MQETNIVPGELKLFLNHIYEFKRGFVIWFFSL